MPKHGMTIKINLPYPPSTNRLWRTNGKGTTYLAPKYAAWRNEAIVAIIGQTKGRTLTGHYRMTLNAVKPDKRRRDLSNILKAAEDALVAAGAIEDDSLSKRIVLEWVDDGPPCEIILETA